MAEELKIGGYQCEFVGPVPEELICKLCNLVARKPHITGCCAEHFCQVCIDTVLQDQKPCPSCGEAGFSTLFMKKKERASLALQLYCTMKERGCKWIGQLEQLDAHLNIEEGDCVYVDVECTLCNQKVQKIILGPHIIEDCPKREFVCPYCTFKATFEIVSETHFPKCPYFPLKCPNECGVTCEREIMEDHMQLCSLEEVECELSYAGCKERFLRQDQDEHMQQNAMKHISLMAAATLRISREFEQKLREKDQRMQELQEVRDAELTAKLEKKDQQMQELLEVRDAELTAKLEKKDQQIEELKKEVKEMGEAFQKAMQEKDQQIKMSAMEVAVIKANLIQAKEKLGHIAPLYSFTVPNFTKLKNDNQYVFSDVFSTHKNGYPFSFGIRPNGHIGNFAAGAGTHVYVWISARPGDSDNTLPWPAKITVTLALLNQYQDRDHLTITKKVEWPRPIGKVFVATISRTLIAHTDLPLNAKNETQYLKDDCLKFIVNDIVVEQ